MPDIQTTVAGYDIPVRTGPGVSEFAPVKPSNETFTLVGCNAAKDGSGQCDPPVGDDDLPVAGFTFSITDPDINEVTFVNNSENGDYYSWDFGDGEVSDDFNPKHEYPIQFQTETYEVTLEVNNLDGVSDIDTRFVTIPGLYDPNTGILSGHWELTNNKYRFYFDISEQYTNYDLYMDFDDVFTADEDDLINGQYFEYEYPERFYDKTYYPILTVTIRDASDNIINEVQFHYEEIFIPAINNVPIDIDLKILSNYCTDGGEQCIALVGEDFRLEATSLNGSGNHHFKWYIYKVPNDPTGGSEEPDYFDNWNASGVSTTGYISRDKIGSYLLVLDVWDEFGNHGQLIDYIQVTNQSGCRDLEIVASGCSSEAVFPIGENIRFTVISLGSSCEGDGVGRIEWYLDGQPIGDATCSIIDAGGSSEDLAWSKCISFPEPREYTIKVKLMEYDNYSHPDGNHYYRIRNDGILDYTSVISRKVKAVDPVTHMEINSNLQLNLLKEHLFAGYLEFCNKPLSEVTIASGEEILATGMQEVTFGPGFTASYGSDFLVKMLDPAENCAPCPSPAPNGDCSQYVHYVIPTSAISIHNSVTRDCYSGTVWTYFTVDDNYGPNHYYGDISYECAKGRNCTDGEWGDVISWNDICVNGCHVSFDSDPVGENTSIHNYYDHILIDKKIKAVLDIWGRSGDVMKDIKSIMFEIGGCWDNVKIDSLEMDSSLIDSDTRNISLLDLKSDYYVKIYPNPTKGTFNVEFSGGLDNIVAIDIYSITGQKIETKMHGIDYVNEFDISGWNYGIYLVRVTTNDGLIVKRLVKE